MDIVNIFCKHARGVATEGHMTDVTELLTACYNLGGELAHRRVSYLLLRTAVEQQRDVLVEFLFSNVLFDKDVDYDFLERLCELAHRLEYMLPIKYMMRCGVHPLSEYLFLHAVRHGHSEAMNEYREAGVSLNVHKARAHICSIGEKRLSDQEIAWRIDWLLDGSA